MPRKRLRFLFLAVLLGAGYWGYARLTAKAPVAPPPQVSEGSAEARLGALRKLGMAAMQRPEFEVESVEIQQLLIAFLDPDGSGSMDFATRSKVDAEQLVADLFSQARAGEDFDDLVNAHTDDSPPGIFLLARDVSRLDPELAQDAVERSQIMPAIGDLSWRLEVGEVGVASYDAQRCPLGWHLIKRLR